MRTTISLFLIFLLFVAIFFAGCANKNIFKFQREDKIKQGTSSSPSIFSNNQTTSTTKGTENKNNDAQKMNEDSGILYLKNGEIDTSNWKSYENKKIGIKLLCPAKWRIEEENEMVKIISNIQKEMRHEPDMIVIKRADNKTVEKFIYELKEVYIDEGIGGVSQKNIIFKNIPATYITGTNALGITGEYIFLSFGTNKYIITYESFNNIHKKLLDNLEFIDQ
jgi:hypothetical protein